MLPSPPPRALMPGFILVAFVLCLGAGTHKPAAQEAPRKPKIFFTYQKPLTRLLAQSGVVIRGKLQGSYSTSRRYHYKLCGFEVIAGEVKNLPASGCLDMSVTCGGDMSPGGARTAQPPLVRLKPDQEYILFLARGIDGGGRYEEALIKSTIFSVEGERVYQYDGKLVWGLDTKGRIESIREKEVFLKQAAAFSEQMTTQQFVSAIVKANQAEGGPLCEGIDVKTWRGESSVYMRASCQ